LLVFNNDWFTEVVDFAQGNSGAVGDKLAANFWQSQFRKDSA